MVWFSMTTFANEQPNILLVMTDDQGIGDLSIGGSPILETPNIDRLANEGVSLSRMYVSPVCTPTRAALMTGRWAERTRAIDTWIGRAMMDPREVTIAEVLRDNGYTTGLFGKWHLGDCAPLRPMDQGFDHVLMHRGGGIAQPSDPIGNDRRYTDPLLFRNGELVRTSGYCMDVYTDEVIEFMTDAAAAGKPFFAYLATNTPHGPLHDVPEKLYDKYRESDLSTVSSEPKQYDEIARVFAMIDNIDSNVGRLMQTLDSLQISENTIVIYMHDNGPAGVRFNQNLRGRKAMVYEGGIRSPLFVRWPGHIKPGRSVHAIAAHVDILPTIIEATQSKHETGPPLDGVSILASLTSDSPSEAQTDRQLFIQGHRGDERIARHQFAVIEQRYKLLRASGFGRESLPADSPLELELYDLIKDPAEEHNLAAAKPDVVTALLKAHDAWFEDVRRSPGWGTPPRILVGSETEPTTVLTRQDWKRSSGSGWGNAGTWLVVVDNPGHFEASVLFRQSVNSPQVTLSFGETTISANAQGPTRQVALEPLNLPAGPHDLRISVTSNGQDISPEHLVISRIKR